MSAHPKRVRSFLSSEANNKTIFPHASTTKTKTKKREQREKATIPTHRLRDGAPDTATREKIILLNSITSQVRHGNEEKEKKGRKKDEK